MKKLKQMNTCTLPDPVTFLVRLSPIAFIHFQQIKILALSSSHTAGLVHGGREEYKLAEFQHNGIFQSGA